MQMGEHDRGQLGGGHPGEPADQRLDERSVAQETGTEPGVDHGVPPPRA